ncbi:MAG: Holliday junction resolvase RuvX [Alphaproteobacteria bacterium]|nr:Holliday junction resolvase RuvX [Alphaproteobacteria bacterium]
MNIKEFKLQLPRNRAIMAFDYGEKRLGVAVSDLLLMTANPITIIQRSNIHRDIKQIKQIITNKEVGAIVYGLPLQMDGTEGKTASIVREFADTINKEINLPYIFWDERLSSRAVETFLIKEIDLSRSKRKQTLDASAAAYILQGVLDALQYA